MTNSAHMARLLGPALVGITVTEWINLDIFVAAAGPTFATHVYLNGTLIFIAGLAIVRAHNIWSLRWPVLITLVGWFAIAAGLGRMIAPVSSQQAGQNVAVLYGSLVLLLIIGVILTYKSLGRVGRERT